jgi:voltage-gated potassium channel
VGAKTWLLLKKLRFLQLILYIIFFLFASPFFGHDWILRLFSSIFLLNALLVSISASVKTVHMKWLLWVLFGAVVIFIALFLSPLVPTKRLMFLQLAIGCEVLVLLVCLGAILAFIFETTQVTLDTIIAAVVAYLFIAFTFAQAYMLLHLFSPQSFNLSEPVTPAAFDNYHGEMFYYSLIVITTLGIGDIVPQTPIARTMTVLEAMIGQFFVAVLVAWLVGRFISQSSGHRPPPD